MNDTNTSPVTTHRQNFLTNVGKAVLQDRQNTHGKPEDTFGTIAKFWSIYLDIEIKPHQVCKMMSLFKTARSKANPANQDNWEDAAGYEACGSGLVPVPPETVVARPLTDVGGMMFTGCDGCCWGGGIFKDAHHAREAHRKFSHERTNEVCPKSL